LWIVLVLVLGLVWGLWVLLGYPGWILEVEEGRTGVSDHHHYVGGVVGVSEEDEDDQDAGAAF